MSLNWNATRCDPAVLDEEHWTVTEVLIFATMAVDMGSITEANVDTFITRIRAVEKVYGPLLRRCDGATGELVDVPMPEEDIRLRIGLTTNVTTTSDAKFRTRMAKALMEQAAR